MQAFSSSKSPFPPFHRHNSSKFPSRFAVNFTHSSYLKEFLLKIPSSSSRESPQFLEEKLLCTESDDEDDNSAINLTSKSPEMATGSISRTSKSFSEPPTPESLLVVRRPVKDGSGEAINDSSGETSEFEYGDGPFSSSPIELGLSKFAKKYPIFEPERVSSCSEKPLGINLELALYRAKVLARNYRFQEAEKLLQQCICFWPDDGRPYVALGRILSKQSKFGEARLVYEKGCQSTQGENPYIWQCWAVLENKIGNIRRARELFDAATVADKRHVAAWHGWAVLELKQGNIKKARNLLGKGLKYCGRNEYIYQTLALLEAKGNRVEQARYLFQQATLCNPKSCASWLAWAQLEMQQNDSLAARKLFEKAVQASPKNRFAWHVWAIFEANQGDIDKGRKLLKIGHALNPRDPVLLQSLALLEYKHSSANIARVLFRRAAELDPKHQPVWMAWGWMEWKEGNTATARELYQRALSIDSTSESAARCLQAWGVLEQRIGNLSAARRLFRSSLNINSQSYVTWMTWASLEEQQGNSVRAEEIRNLYFQQRTEVVDDASWVMGFLDIINPALNSIKRLLNLDLDSNVKGQEHLRDIIKTSNNLDAEKTDFASSVVGSNVEEGGKTATNQSDFDLDAFIRDKLSLDALQLDAPMVASDPMKIKSPRRIWKSERRITIESSQR